MTAVMEPVRAPGGRPNHAVDRAGEVSAAEAIVAGEVSAADAIVADPVSPSQGADVGPVGRYVWTPEEIERVEGVSEALRGRTVAVVGGDDAWAAAVVAQLRRGGATAVRPPRPGASRVEEAVQAFLAPVRHIDGIIDLNLSFSISLDSTLKAGTGNDDGPPDSAGDWAAPFDQTLAVLRACYGDWATETDAQRLFYLPVTRMGGQMGFGVTGATHPMGGLWAGLAKGLPREIPNCNIRIVDLEADLDAEAAAALVCGELYRWGLFEVGHRAGRRYTLRARAQVAAPPRIALERGDVVVMSGGGRGIGFALALKLARDHGCRVVVSGRGPAPDPADPVLTMPESDFRVLRARRLTEAARLRQVPVARADLDRLARDRDVLRNLDRARAVGADIRYVRCDVTDAADVVALLDQAGGPVVGVIHNAGLDVPARLPAKAAATARQVVRVKVDGFANLLAALRGRTAPRFFCNVGSLTGRWGGMVGQLDYGAANEALSRLGLAAARTHFGGRTTVKTLCWPTWDRLGMITNYQATLRYMSALDVSDGVRLWRQELLGGASGEVTFIGAVGSALVPGLLRGYPARSELPGIDRLASALYFLGTPIRFSPYREIDSQFDIWAEAVPGCHDFRIEGGPALPISLCVEHLLAAGDWIRPDGFDHLVVSEVGDLDITLAGLALPGGAAVTLVKRAAGQWSQGAWRVSVSMFRDGVPVASAEVLYRPRRDRRPSATTVPRALPTVPRALPTVPWALPTAPAGPLVPLADAVPRSPGPLHWGGQAFRVAPWPGPRPDPTWSARVAADRMADILPASVHADPVIGLNLLESVVRHAYLDRMRVADGFRPARVHVERIELGDPVDGGEADLRVDPATRTWTAGRAGEPAFLRITHLNFT